MSSSVIEQNGIVERTFKNKIERYAWKAPTNKPSFEWIDKHLINIDHEYQRDKISNAKVLEIAKNWSWMACGAVLVARRKDGTLWAYDGQHRTIAARRRDDIKDLPCLVFDVDEKRIEASGFVSANTVRGPVKSIDCFKARLSSQDSIALDVAAMVESIGYSVADGAAKFTLKCVKAIETELVRDRVTCEVCLGVCAEIFEGEPIKSDIFKGLCFINAMLKKTGESVSRPDIRGKLIKVGPQELERAVNSAIAYRGGGGERVYADGIANVINKGKRQNAIPAVFK